MISVEENLKELILSKYKSLREFTIKIGMPYSTMDTILKRGVSKANIINILKICNELNISADKLATGIIENVTLTNNNLSTTEETLLSNYNKLNDFGKEEAVKRVSELTEIQKYIDKNTPDSKPVIEDEFYLIAAHDDNLTDEEKDVMNSRINEALKKMK